MINIEKNKDYIIDITALGVNGEGIGKLNNFTVFVNGALEGEKVEIKLIKVNKSYGFGKLLKIIEASPYRVESKCAIYNKCGGCSLQHLLYDEQIKYKKKKVIDCLIRIGKLNLKSEGIIVHDTIGMDIPYRYRNKVQLPVGDKAIGFYSAGSHNVIDVKECIIQHEAGDKVIHIFKEWIKKYNISHYDEKKGTGLIRHIMVRKAFKTGETMVVIVTSSNKLPFAKELIEELTLNIDGIASIVQNINTKNTNVVLGSECKTLWGKATIIDTIGEFKFNISPLSFFQVNPIQTEILYNKVLEYAKLQGDEVVFDAYCGTGTISLFLSKRAKEVYGVEIIAEAIENAKENALQNDVENAHFYTGEAEKVIPKLISEGKKADVVVVDPPRKGCEKSLLEAIAKMSPQRIVYVSCDPATLARDLGILEELSYRTVEVQPVDMFPMTGHVEVVTLLTRRETTK